jgi:hypothetical protein
VGQGLPAADVDGLLRDFTALSDAEKTRFLGELTADEFVEVWAHAPKELRTEMFAHLSADAAADLYRTTFPEFRDRILAGVPAKVVPRIAPNPRGHRFVPWRSTRAKLYDGEPKLGDVAQGWHQTCWCLGSMQAVVEQAPDLIKNMILANENGTFTVLFRDGKEVTVTSDLPLDAAHTGRAPWPAIMEKAFAQQFGGYGTRPAGASARCRPSSSRPPT